MDAITAEEMGLARPYFPNGTKQLRACLRCRFIMEMEQFITAGCPTCREVLFMKGDPARVRACTTTRFAGVMAMMRPGSFVTRYNGLEKRMPGFYALRTYGKIPVHIRNEREMAIEEDEEFERDFIAPPTPTGEPPAKRAREDDERSIDSGIFTPEAEREKEEKDELDALFEEAGAEAESEREDEPASPAVEPSSLAAAEAAKADSGSESKEDLPVRQTGSASEAEKSASGASGAESNKTRTSGEESKASAGTSASSHLVLEPEPDEEFRKYHGK